MYNTISTSLVVVNRDDNMVIILFGQLFDDF
jgi:hypothetical protein